MSRSFALVIVITAILGAPPARAGNDNSCDIGVTPAATLLLPYFEVDFVSPAGSERTTIFTVTNVSPQPQIAHITLWTDWAYAALGFNVFLPPYGIQSIDLRELFVRGTLMPGASRPGLDALAGAARRNPNLESRAGAAADITSACAEMPTALTAAALTDLRKIFTTGVPGTSIGNGCPSSRLGGSHANATGYLTIDVVATCTTNVPGPAYFAEDALFDNVLLGDYLNIDADETIGNWATGNPMVHIRATPEGGPAGSNPGTNLPFTFYDRFTATTPQTLPRSIDRRQPLPSAFAARWTYGERFSLMTTFQIWREGVSGPSSTSCAVAANASIPLGYGELVRFDEYENSNSIIPYCSITCDPLHPRTAFPATSSTPSSSSLFPGLTASGDLSGWMYFNFNTGGYPAFSDTHRAGQSWVSVTIVAEGRSAVQFDAAAMGNGCSPPIAPFTPINPAGGAPVCPAGVTGCTPGVAPYTGTNGPP